MDTQNILKYVDHTNLSQTAVWQNIQELCDEAIKFKTASVCIQPCFVKKAKKYVGENTKIATVVGFPNGYNTTEAKIFETENALFCGADEIDMVININDAKAHNYQAIEKEITAIKKVCGSQVLKVIIETCYLANDEKIELCKAVTRAEADYIKTSTGFGKGGATRDDIILFTKHIGKNVKIKAAGGIRTLEAAEDFINLGCSRIGASAIVKLIADNIRQ